MKSFSSKNVYHIYCNIEFMVHPIMSDEFLFVKKRLSHWLHFEFMVQNMMSDEFPSRQKTFIAFTALRVHGTAHNVCWISFCQKNVSRIECTSSSWYSPWCFLTFLLVFTRFSHFPQVFSTWIFIIIRNLFHIPCIFWTSSSSPLSENLIWKYQTCENIHCYHHSCPIITTALAAHAQ